LVWRLPCRCGRGGSGRQGHGDVHGVGL